MQKVLIDKDTPLKPGDRIEMHFKSIGMTYIKAAQVALLEKRLAGRQDFTVTGIQAPADQPTTLIFHIEIKGGLPPGVRGIAGAAAVVTAAKIAAIIAALGLFYLALHEVYLIVKEVTGSPAGQVGFAGMGIGLAAAGIVALLALLPKK